MKTISGSELSKVLDTFSPEVINKQPATERELLELYKTYSDPLFAQARTMQEDNLFVISNEVRAMFGHLAEYKLNPKERKNLSDAYGHFRRLNLDIFKIICDRLDDFLYTYFIKHYHYDYRKINKEFLLMYTEKYLCAKDSYMDAQLNEHTGSNRANGNLVEKYYKAAQQYVALLAYLQENCKGIEATKRKTIFKMVCSIVVGIVGIILSF